MFLDTSGLMCLFDLRDRRHAKAVSLYDSALTRFTHNYVLAEFVALSIARQANTSNALSFIKAIQKSGEVEVVWVDPDLHELAMDLLINRDDKSWYLCDAISFLVMREHDQQEALTTDHHFEQAGLTRLLDR
jgi:predicted nucleic acid-binding protein